MKFFLLSKTVWGLIIATAPGWLSIFGVDWSADDTAVAEEAGYSLIDGLEAAAVAVGSLIALWGRKTAKTPITFVGEQ